MPRPRLCRRIGLKPKTTYFKPAGVRMIDLDESVLTVDEYEAVRLKDLEELDQEVAAKKMNISQPTFHRMILSARKKISDAIVNGKAIKIEGGNFKMVQPGRGAGQGRGAGRGAGQGRGRGFGGPAMICVCSSCGFQQSKQRGIPCSTLKCPKCGAPMIRGQ